MKPIAIVAVLALTGTVSMTALAGPGVDVNVGVGSPGYFGPINGGAPASPALIYPTPTVVQPVAGGVTVAPMYLRVPPAQYHDWHHYCGYYRACARPVYFVSDNWYRHRYVPAYHRVIEHHIPHFDDSRHRTLR